MDFWGKQRDWKYARISSISQHSELQPLVPATSSTTSSTGRISDDRSTGPSRAGSRVASAVRFWYDTDVIGIDVGIHHADGGE